MMAAILHSAMLDSDTATLDSDTLLSSLRFTQKHSHSTLTLTPTNSIWLIWWWQPSWILPSCFQPFLHKTLTQTNSIWLNLIHSYSTWCWQPSWILPLAIKPFWTIKISLIHSDSLDDGSHLEFYHPEFSQFAQKKLHSFILTQLDDGSHLEFCHAGFSHSHLGFRHLVIFSQIHSKTLLLHSDSDYN